MKKWSREIIGCFFVLVLMGNLALFVSSMKLSTEIHEYELKAHTLTQENLVLEKKLADDISFKSLDAYEKKWGFVHASKPVYIGELQFALNSTR